MCQIFSALLFKLQVSTIMQRLNKYLNNRNIINEDYDYEYKRRMYVTYCTKF